LKEAMKFEYSDFCFHERILELQSLQFVIIRLKYSYNKRIG